MAYDRTKEATIVIDRQHHEMLKKMADADKRKLKNTTELVIEQAYTHFFGDTNKTS